MNYLATRPKMVQFVSQALVQVECIPLLPSCLYVCFMYKSHYLGFTVFLSAVGFPCLSVNLSYQHNSYDRFSCVT